VNHLEEQFKGRKFWNYLSIKKTDIKKKTYTLESVGMDPDTGAPMMNYRADKSGTLYTMDANRFFGMAKSGKKWLPRFLLAAQEFQTTATDTDLARQEGADEEDE